MEIIFMLLSDFHQPFSFHISINPSKYYFYCIHKLYTRIFVLTIIFIYFLIIYISKLTFIFNYVHSFIICMFSLHKNYKMNMTELYLIVIIFVLVYHNFVKSHFSKVNKVSWTDTVQYIYHFQLINIGCVYQV